MVALVKTREEILDTLREHRADLKRFGVKKIGLFGSYVRGEQRPDSDIDLLVEFEPGRKTFKAFIGLCFYLDELLQQKVELVTTESLSPYIGPYILQEVQYASLAA